MKTKKYPVALEENGARVVIRKVRDHGSEAFRIEYYVAGKRRMKTRADEREAHTDAWAHPRDAQRARAGLLSN